jgi:hypothetical protein
VDVDVGRSIGVREDTTEVVGRRWNEEKQKRRMGKEEENEKNKKGGRGGSVTGKRCQGKTEEIETLLNTLSHLTDAASIPSIHPTNRPTTQTPHPPLTDAASIHPSNQTTTQAPKPLNPDNISRARKKRERVDVRRESSRREIVHIRT